jgi:hypothetical protein
VDGKGRDLLRVQAVFTAGRGGIVEWINGDAWGYREETGAQGRWLEVESAGQIPEGAAGGEMSIEIANRDGQRFVVELDALAVRTASECVPAIWPRYNLVTRGERFLPILIAAERSDGLTARLDHRVLSASLPPGALRTVIPLAGLSAGTHTLRLTGESGVVAHRSAFTILPDAL